MPSDSRPIGGSNVRRIASMSDDLSKHCAEDLLRDCKIKYRVLIDGAAIARELLLSGNRLGNFHSSETLRPRTPERPNGVTSSMVLVSAQIIEKMHDDDETPLWGAC